MRLHFAHADRFAVGPKFERVAGANAAADDRTGDDGAAPRDGKHAVDGHAEGQVGLYALDFPGLGDDRGPQFIQSGTLDRRDANHRRASQRRTFKHLSQFGFDEVDETFVDEVALVDRDHRPRYAEQLQNLDVLDGLGHHRIVSRHDDQRQVNTRRAGYHRAHETLVPRNIDHAEIEIAQTIGITQPKLSEPKLDGHPAALLFGQTIGVRPGQRLDQRSLAMIDMPGSTEDEVVG